MRLPHGNNLYGWSSTIVVVVLGDGQKLVVLRGICSPVEDDVDVAVSLEGSEAGGGDGDDWFLDLLSEPAGHEFLVARAAEVDGEAVLEEHQRGETLDLELSLQGLAVVEVHLCQSHWMTTEIPSGRMVRSSAASSIQTGASFLQWVHQGV
jgi:hypothetical protein